MLVPLNLCHAHLFTTVKEGAGLTCARLEHHLITMHPSNTLVTLTVYAAVEVHATHKQLSESTSMMQYLISQIS